jgi:bidirectional [NiFe] hydrogenase diaphorase subunit
MATVTIDGRKVDIDEGRTALEAAQAAGVQIPTLCYHPAVAPYGACRLCLVEATLRGRTRMVTSCCYPVREGMEIATDTERVKVARRGVMELLLARAPQSESLREFAAGLGVTELRFPTVTRADHDCILCGLCVSVCSEVMGVAAISFASRGVDRVVATPFLRPAEACVGCGACEAVCPVGAIHLQWTDGQIEVSPFSTRLPMTRCEECNAPITGLPFRERLEKELRPELAGALRLCDSCKRIRAAAVVKKASHLNGSAAAVNVPRGQVTTGHSAAIAPVRVPSH